MYPTIQATIVIVLVQTQRSMTDIFELSLSNASRLADLVASDHEARAATLRRPSFAVGPVDSVMDDEAESLPPPARCRAMTCRDVAWRSSL